MGELEALRQQERASPTRKTLVAIVLSLIVMVLMMWPPMTLPKSLISAVHP